jgi:hypothetical protein
VSESQILMIWPGSDPARLRLRRIEDYLARNYHVRAAVPYADGSLEILEPRVSSCCGAIR